VSTLLTCIIKCQLILHNFADKARISVEQSYRETYKAELSVMFIFNISREETRTIEKKAILSLPKCT